MNARLLLTCIVFYCGIANAQEIQYIDARTLNLYGKAHSGGAHYHRVDTARYSDMPRSVKRLSTQASGLCIAFKTNSREIHARWSTPITRTLRNLPAVASHGLDLYIRRDGQWVFAGAAVPHDSVSTRRIVGNMAEGEKECLLFLPLYAELFNLEIGVQPGSTLESLSIPWKGKVVIYGSSITQGASASRPGMSYPSILSRHLGYEFVNLGFSGSGKMEESVSRMIADIKEVDLFILDCAANPSPQQIEERTESFVKYIRQHHPNVPILMIASVVREGSNFDSNVREMVTGQNSNFEKAYKRLLASGVKNLHFIKGDELLGRDHEGTIDGTHPNDLGFDRMVKVIEPRVRKLLRK